MFPMKPRPEEPSSITQAKRVLRWLDQHLQYVLPEDRRNTFQSARQAYGSPATTNRARLWSGGPAVHVPRMKTTGTGDDAYGHNRVIEITRKVVIPMIEAGELEPGWIAQFSQMLRGEFGHLIREIETPASKHRNESSVGGQL